MAADIEVNMWRPVIPVMSQYDIVRFQLMVHCHVEHIKISSADLDCLTLIGQIGKAELTAFCQMIASEGIFKTAQSSRNALTRLEEKNLIVKEGKNKKKISLSPLLKIQSRGNIMIDIKCFSPQKEFMLRK